ncbi:hypothetical protein [Leuconostoc citreum]|uniref:hypothetical protein n=1 Tax=Leuconostoc citreum TaxID=33964 RepID=UPI0011BB6956|nr:hypothetical protein [Leuconostoc citreum]QEA54585.1 hypothetical protein FGL76_00380 [Leuconostoc citreum]
MAYKTHVAKILNEKSIILAAGWHDGIDKGDEFNIVEIGKEVKDDSTGEILGTYDRIKVKVEITEIYESFSIAQKLQRVSVLSPLVTTGAFGNRTIAQELPVSNEDIDPVILNDFDKNVRLGDVAVKINS